MTVQVVTVRWGAADENADQIGLAFVAFMKLRTNSRRAEDALRRICAISPSGGVTRFRYANDAHDGSRAVRPRGP